MSRSLIVSMLLLAGLAAGTTGARAESPLPQAGGSVDPTRLGPQVGDTVPAISLPDQHGEVQTLRSLTGPQGMMLVFNRATAW